MATVSAKQNPVAISTSTSATKRPQRRRGMFRDITFDRLESFFINKQQCRRGESNPYTLRYRILSPARLPIPPLLLRRRKKGLERLSSRGQMAWHRDKYVEKKDPGFTHAGSRDPNLFTLPD